MTFDVSEDYLPLRWSLFIWVCFDIESSIGALKFKFEGRVFCHLKSLFKERESTVILAYKSNRKNKWQKMSKISQIFYGFWMKEWEFTPLKCRKSSFEVTILWPAYKLN